MIGDLSGRTALVTGAGSGIGRGIALTLAEQGASVAVTDLSPESAQATADAFADGASLALALDVTSRSSMEAVVDRIVSEWGRVDILVNNAGIPSGSVVGGEDSEEDWDRTFAVNVKGTVHCCEAVIPRMRERRYGKIIKHRLDGRPLAETELGGLRREQGCSSEAHEGSGRLPGGGQHQRQRHLSGRGVDAVPGGDV